ncbi:MAG: hypothetical protein QOJ19_1948, partial [Acidimicrobiia bacterium]|nr:hypothetical protein [Acidimicrobiia bacterium]
FGCGPYRRAIRPGRGGAIGRTARYREGDDPADADQGSCAPDSGEYQDLAESLVLGSCHEPSDTAKKHAEQVDYCQQAEPVDPTSRTDQQRRQVDDYSEAEKRGAEQGQGLCAARPPTHADVS